MGTDLQIGATHACVYLPFWKLMAHFVLCRHPLLLGRHLQEKERNQQQVRRGQHGAQLRRLSNRKQSTQPEFQNGTQMRKGSFFCL